MIPPKGFLEQLSDVLMHARVSSWIVALTHINPPSPSFCCPYTLGVLKVEPPCIVKSFHIVTSVTLNSFRLLLQLGT